MTRRIAHRTRSAHPAAEVYAALVDPAYLESRLAELGGPGAAVLERTDDAGVVRYRIRHGIDERNLPPLVRSLVGGTLSVERTETWQPTSSGHYAGTVEAGVPGAPGWIRGGMRLDDVPDGGSELVVDGETKMNVPLLGGTIEDVIADNLVTLLDAETAFTTRWLAR